MEIRQRSGWSGLLGTALLLAVSVGAAVEEAAFRRSADLVPVVVREWRSDKLVGLRGTATVEFNADGPTARHFGAKVRTKLFYSPKAGDRVEVFAGKEGRVRMAGLWQGFGLSMLAGLGAIGWFMDGRAERRKQGASAL